MLVFISISFFGINSEVFIQYMCDIHFQYNQALLKTVSVLFQPKRRSARLSAVSVSAPANSLH